MATVLLGGASRQFVRLADNSWIAPGPGYATMIQNGTRAPTNYICPIVLHPQDPQYAQSRGWDDSAMSFDVVNQHGDIQHFGYFAYKYDTDSGVFCARQLGFRLDNWSFPQGPIVSLTYGADSGAWNLETVKNNMGQQLDLSYAAGGYFAGADDNHGRSIAYTAAGAADTLGHFTGFGGAPRPIGGFYGVAYDTCAIPTVVDQSDGSSSTLRTKSAPIRALCAEQSSSPNRRCTNLHSRCAVKPFRGGRHRPANTITPVQDQAYTRCGRRARAALRHAFLARGSC